MKKARVRAPTRAEGADTFLTDRQTAREDVSAREELSEREPAGWGAELAPELDAALAASVAAGVPTGAFVPGSLAPPDAARAPGSAPNKRGWPKGKPRGPGVVGRPRKVSPDEERGEAGLTATAPTATAPTPPTAPKRHLSESPESREKGKKGMLLLGKARLDEPTPSSTIGADAARRRRDARRRNSFAD